MKRSGWLRLGAGCAGIVVACVSNSNAPPPSEDAGSGIDAGGTCQSLGVSGACCVGSQCVQDGGPDAADATVHLDSGPQTDASRDAPIDSPGPQDSGNDASDAGATSDASDAGEASDASDAGEANDASDASDSSDASPAVEAGIVTEFTIGTGQTVISIISGPGGSGVWFTVSTGNVDQMSVTGTVTGGAALGGAGPIYLTVGQDGNVWVTLYNTGQIARVEGDGGYQTFSLPSSSAGPAGICAGPDGNLWFAETSANKIGTMATDGGLIAEYPVPSTLPTVIVTGADGNLWFTNRETSQIARLTPDGGTLTEYGPFTGANPGGLTVGPDGHIWFTETTSPIGTSLIASILSDGGFVEYPVLTTGAGVDKITAGPDGNLWFTEGNVGQIGRITPAGVVTEFKVPTANAVPEGICVGPDGNVWFTEGSAGKVGYVTP